MPKPGRPEKPLDPAAGPEAEFALSLRKLRADAGSPSYRAMEKEAHYSASVLSEAASGKKVPPWDVVKAYIRACAGDPAGWRRRWESVMGLPETTPEQRPGISPYGDSRYRAIRFSAGDRTRVRRTALAWLFVFALGIAVALLATATPVPTPPATIDLQLAPQCAAAGSGDAAARIKLVAGPVHLLGERRNGYRFDAPQASTNAITCTFGISATADPEATFTFELGEADYGQGVNEVDYGVRDSSGNIVASGTAASGSPNALVTLPAVWQSQGGDRWTGSYTIEARGHWASTTVVVADPRLVLSTTAPTNTG